MKNKLYCTILFVIVFIFQTRSQSPDWSWVSTTVGVGPAQASAGKSLITDDNGNSYITGGKSGPVLFGNILLTGSGMFIVKYDSVGNVIWAHDTNRGTGDGISLDGLGNCYVAGTFNDTIIFNNDTLITNHNSDIFVAKYDTAGNFLWLRGAGGISYDISYGIATDSLGNSFVTGSFKETIRFGNDSLISRGFEDIFIAKYNYSGNLIWIRSAGGNDGDISYSISLDAMSNIYITGSFGDTAIFGNDTLFANSNPHIFIAKYDSSGNCDWVRTNVGGSQVFVEGQGISADRIGNSFVTGFFRDSLILGHDTVTATFNRPVIFTAKFDSSGNEQWIQKAEAGNLNNRGKAISTDNSGNCYVTGQFKDSANFSNSVIYSIGLTDIFVVKYDANGIFQWVKKAGGNAADDGRGISTDGYGNCFVTGGAGSDTAWFDSIIVDVYGHDMYLAKIGCTGIQPEISFSGVDLYSTSAVTYHWFLNGVLILGATLQSYTPLQNGIYVVFTKDANGCGTSSLPYNFVGLGINEAGKGIGIYVFPNPSYNVFNFGLSDATDFIQKIEIRNLLGEKIISSAKNKIDLSAFAEGIYFYSVKTKSGKLISGKVLKQ